MRPASAALLVAVVLVTLAGPLLLLLLPAQTLGALANVGQAVGGLVSSLALIGLVLTVNLQRIQTATSTRIVLAQTKILARQLRAQSRQLLMESAIALEVFLRSDRVEVRLVAVVGGRGLAKVSGVRSVGQFQSSGSLTFSDVLGGAVRQALGSTAAGVRVEVRPVPSRLPPGEHVLSRVTGLKGHESDLILSALQGTVIEIECEGLDGRRRPGARIDFSNCTRFGIEGR